MTVTSCQFTATLSGIGDFVVGSATAGHNAPEASNVIDGKVYTYYATAYDTKVPPNITGWEAGSGAYHVSTHTLQRTTIKANSDGTSIPVSFLLPPIVDVYASPAGSLEPPGVLRSYLAGLTLSTAGASTTFSVAAGQAVDSTNAGLMSLASAITKTTAAWAFGPGNGALDTGTIAASTWYHVYLIKRLDIGVVAVLVSLSATAPTLPTSYTLFRRLGSMKTDGSSNWTAFLQDGDLFQWATTVQDITANNPGTAAVTRTMSTPLGIRVEGIFNVGAACGVSGATISLSDLSTTDQTLSITVPNYSIDIFGSAATQVSVGNQRVFTNTLSQIRSRVATSAADITLYISTRGWIDHRGRDA
jgi:hypothetical protein